MKEMTHENMVLLAQEISHLKEMIEHAKTHLKSLVLDVGEEHFIVEGKDAKMVVLGMHIVASMLPNFKVSENQTKEMPKPISPTYS